MDENPEGKQRRDSSTATDHEDLLDARQACALLDVKAATLYTYVSRGLLQPVRNVRSKGNLYRREELESLRLRSTARAGQGAVAAQAMHFGHPVLTSSITEITPAGPRYRGHLATDLARAPGAFENVAELLWTGALPDEVHAWPAQPPLADVQRALDAMAVVNDAAPRVMRLFAITATMLDSFSIGEELRSGSTTHFARQLLFAFAGCCGMLGPEGRFVFPQGEVPLAQHVLEALGTQPTPAALHAVNAALILGADHELSSPTFAARIAASVGSGLHACIVAALATQCGVALAGAGDVTEDLIRGMTSTTQLHERVAEIERRRQHLPGFSHPLYPQGDPRATALIELARSTGPGSPQAELACHFVDTLHQELGVHPNIEIGLVVLGLAWGLPPRSANALWGIGRTAGWIAHVLEQRLAGIALRPRGQFRTSGL